MFAFFLSSLPPPQHEPWNKSICWQYVVRQLVTSFTPLKERAVTWNKRLRFRSQEPLPGSSQCSRSPRLTQQVANKAHLGKLTDVTLSWDQGKSVGGVCKSDALYLFFLAPGAGLIRQQRPSGFPGDRSCLWHIYWKGWGRRGTWQSYGLLVYKEVCMFAPVKETDLWPNFPSLDGCHSPVSMSSLSNPNIMGAALCRHFRNKQGDALVKNNNKQQQQQVKRVSREPKKSGTRREAWNSDSFPHTSSCYFPPLLETPYR